MALVSQAELLDLIQTVDASFDRPGSKYWARMIARELLNSGAGFAFLFITLAFALAFAQSASKLDLLTVLTGLVVVGTFYLIGLTLLAPNPERSLAIKEDEHFRKLRSCSDQVTVRALVRMRVRLPKGMKLMELYEHNKSVFSQKALVERLLDGS